MRAHRRIGALVVLLAVNAACSDGTPTNPSVTAAPTYTVRGTVLDMGGTPVSGALVEIADGAFAGKSATTDFEGAYRLFAVNGSFLLRVSKPGYTTYTEQVGNLTADRTVTVHLRTALPTLTGRITEAPPTTAKAVAGARILIVDSTTTARTTSDRDGMFTVQNLTCPCSLQVEANGYEPRTVGTATAFDDPLIIQLLPSARVVTETIGSPSGPRRPPASFFRDVHQPGRIVVSRLYFYYSPGIRATRTVELWDGARLIAAASVNQQQWFTDVLDVEVAGGARYEIRITGGEWSAVTITSPI